MDVAINKANIEAQEETFKVGKVALGLMLEQLEQFVKDGRMALEDAVSMVGNLVDLDMTIPTTPLEIFVSEWLDNMEKYFI